MHLHSALNVVGYAFLIVTCSLPAAAQWTEQDCRAIHSIPGESPGDQHGWVANPIGDVNGDGTPDIYIGDFGPRRLPRFNAVIGRQ